MTARAKADRDHAVSDHALMMRLADGDLSALGEIYDRYALDVRRFVLRATSRHALADDVTQDTFVAVVGAAKRYDGGRPLRAYLLGIAGKLILRQRRHAALTSRILADMRAWLRQADDRDPERTAVADQELLRFQRALDRLPLAKRVTVVLSDVEGFSGPEIAEALDVPVATVWTRLHHARAALRLALGRESRS